MEETFLPGAKESILSILAQHGNLQDISVFVDRMKDTYIKTGSIGKIGQYFSDGGKQAVAALERLTKASEAVSSKKTITTDTVAETKYDHLYDEEKAGQDFINAVDEDMLSFIDKAASNQNDSSSVYVIGKTTNKLNHLIKKLTGIDTTLFNHYIKANSVRHIIKDHGINGLADKSMSDVEDIARMGYNLG